MIAWHKDEEEASRQGAIKRENGPRNRSSIDKPTGWEGGGGNGEGGKQARRGGPGGTPGCGY